MEFAQAKVTVATLGTEFLTGVQGTVLLPDFPYPGLTRTLRWQQAQQNFVITDGSPERGGGTGGSPSRVLENPAPGSFQSGLGLISGWVCDAQAITISLNDGPPQAAAYGTSRGDTQGRCGDTDNGFGLLFNWNLLGDGHHTVAASADGVEFARVEVSVTTLDGEFFFDQGRSRRVRVPDFPEVGTATDVVWQASLQNFVITPDGPDPPANVRVVPSARGYTLYWDATPEADLYTVGIRERRYDPVVGEKIYHAGSQTLNINWFDFRLTEDELRSVAAGYTPTHLYRIQAISELGGVGPPAVGEFTLVLNSDPDPPPPRGWQRWAEDVSMKVQCVGEYYVIYEYHHAGGVYSKNANQQLWTYRDDDPITPVSFVEDLTISCDGARFLQIESYRGPATCAGVGAPTCTSPDGEQVWRNAGHPRCGGHPRARRDYDFFFPTYIPNRHEYLRPFLPWCQTEQAAIHRPYGGWTGGAGWELACLRDENGDISFCGPVDTWCTEPPSGYTCTHPG